jgi:LuxR family maltose regulon positive regulatory protein
MDRYNDGMRAMRARLAGVQAALRSVPAASANIEPLTIRELDVLRHLQGSSSLNQIAAELYLSPNTVKTHTKAVYRKLGASSRTDAVQIARQRLLI